MKLTERTDLLRDVAVVLCVACGIVYFAIGLGFIYEQRPDGIKLWLFGYSAAFTFAVGAALLLVKPGRFVWTLGAVWMVLVIVAYVLVAPSRHPNFEIWGISLKAAQAVTLLALLGLLASERRNRVAERRRIFPSLERSESSE